MAKAITAITLFFLIALAGIAIALPVKIEEVKIDGSILQESAENTLALERGQNYEVRVRFTPERNIKNAEVRVFISGYEYSDINEISDRTAVFDADENVTYVKKFTIKVPDNADEDNYKLRVLITDKFSDEKSASYNLKLDVPRNALKIDDIIFSPSGAIKAGSALLTKARIANKGEKTQEDVRVTVSIPGLGVSATEYIDEIKNNDDREETEEIYLRIPKCSKQGNYEINIEAEFSQRTRKITEKKTITILEDEACKDEAARTTIALGSQSKGATAGQTIVFPITITNQGRTSKTFVLSVPESDWATASITPTSMAVVQAGQTQTVFANVNINEKTPAGMHSLTATISSEETQQELTLTAEVVQTKSGMRGILEATLTVLVVLLVIIGIIIGIAHLREREQKEAYY